MSRAQLACGGIALAAGLLGYGVRQRAWRRSASVEAELHRDEQRLERWVAHGERWLLHFVRRQ